MATRYVGRLPEKLRHEALELYLEVLGDKLVPVLGTMEKAKRLLARDLSPQRCMAAFRGERLAGVLCVQTPAGSFWNPSMESLIEEYGTMEALFRLLGLCFLHHETEAEEWYIDGIAVAEWARGEGIGSGLIDRLEKLAVENGGRKDFIGSREYKPPRGGVLREFGLCRSSQVEGACGFSTCFSNCLSRLRFI